MASLLEIEDAIRKASAKGDKETVQKLGVHWNNMKSQSSNTGNPVGNALKRGYLNTKSTIPAIKAQYNAARFQQSYETPEERITNGVLQQLGQGAKPALDAAIADGYDFSNNQSAAKWIHNFLGNTAIAGRTVENFLNVQNEINRSLEESGVNKPGSDARETWINNGAKALLELTDLQNQRSSIKGSNTAERYKKLLGETPDTFIDFMKSIGEDPAGFGAFIGETALESSPQLAAGLATTFLTRSPVLGSMVLGGGTLTQEYGSSVDQFLKEEGVVLETPEHARRLLADKELMGKASQRGVIRALTIAAFEMAGMGLAGKSFMKNVGTQMLTGGAGEATAQYASGQEISPTEIAIEALAETATAPVEAAIATGRKVKNGELFKTDKKGNKFAIRKGDLTPEDSQAAGSFALLLETAIEENNLDVNDVQKLSEKGAFKALEIVHDNLAQSLNTLFSNVKGLVDPKKATTLESLEQRILALAAKRQARNKAKGRVGAANLKALEELVSDTGDGQALLNTVRMLDVLTQVHNNGYQGKLSSFTDTLALWGSKSSMMGYDSGKAGFEKFTRPIVSGLAATKTGGASLIPQVVAPKIGTALDKYRGTYSSIDRFINQNKNNETLPAVDKPLIAEAQASEAAEAEAVQAELDASTAQFNRELGRENAPPTPTSPEGTVQEATGLNKQGIARVIRVLKSSKASNKPLMKAIKDYEESIDTGGFVGDLSPLIRQVKLFIKDNPNYVYDAPNVQTEIGGGFQPGGITTNTSSGYNRGIEDNKRFVGDLQQRANKDKSLSVTDRGQILTALDTMSRNLGSDPMTTSQQIHDKLLANDVNTQAVGMYVKPYVDRIANQQNTAPKLNEVVNETMEAPDIITRASQEFAVDQGPALEQSITNENILPTNEEVIAMRDGTFIPDEKRQLVEAADLLNERWKQITGREEPFEYTDENVEVISDSMAREAVNNLSKDGNAIGWYDRKIKAAKQVLSLIEPRINQSPEAEAAFDFALAVTSNGQAVEMNFEYAVDVFRQFMDTGSMPTNFKQGGERNAAMRTAFDFFNAYNTSAVNEPIQMFLDRDFTVATLNNTISQFNKKHGTNIKVPSSETVNTPVKGSYILGPKIGQGFYQNIRGNYEPLTMDIWWMRMWNRMVGRPFEATKSPKFMTTSRDKLATQIKKSTGLEKKLINETLKATNETKKGLYKDTVRFEKFIKALDKRYQRFYTQYKKDNGVNHTKPQLFKSTGTYTKNMVKQLQAQPTPADRPYMRRVTVRALEKLREQGIDITTADFQALMWYPEKLLYRKLGVQPGNGSDNDYLDAARLLAQKEGISNDQIQEALPQSERDGEVDNRTSTTAPNEGVYRDVSQSGNEGGGILTAPGSVRRSQDFPSGADVNGPTVSSQGVTQGQPIRGSFFPGDPPTAQDAKPFLEKAKSVFEIGKKGSPYEKGIGTIAEAKQLADALNVTLKLLDKIPEPYGKASGLFTIQGNQKGDLPGGIASVVKQGAPDPAYPNPITAPARTELEELFTALHELGHAIALPGVDREANLGYMLSDNPLLTEGNIEQVQIGSFESIVASLLETETIRVDIIDEIINLQENIDVTSERKPNLGSRFVRHHRAAIKNTQEGAYNKALSEGMLDPEGFATREVDKAQKRIEQNRTTYTRTISELATDALWVYMAAPKLMKEAAPETSKLIQEVFSTLGGPKQPMTFYTFPITAIMAGVLAMMAKGAEEDEERNRLMQAPPGALTPPPAALSGMMI